MWHDKKTGAVEQDAVESQNVGTCGWYWVTSDLICTMSKREGKLSDKDLKDNIWCLDHEC